MVSKQHTFPKCSSTFTTYEDDTSESGECWGRPDLCWSCADEERQDNE